MRVAVIGCGYVGSVTAACFAWLGNAVRGFDADAGRASALAAGRVPFYEPGLPDLLREVLALGRLTFSCDPADALAGADIAFLCVGTPSGAGGRPDLSQLEHAVDVVTAHVRPDTVVVAKSTVPVGSGWWLQDRLEAGLPAPSRRRVHVVSNPEFLREGTAIEDFLTPDRVVLGGDPVPVQRVLRLYRPVLDQTYPGADPARLPALYVMDLPSAEMVKYAANAALATKISFANEISQLCELTGADARVVLPAVGADRRIGAAFLRPGLGWGGSCLPKDVSALIGLGHDLGHDAPLLRGVREVNDRRHRWAMQRLEQELGRSRADGSPSSAWRSRGQPTTCGAPPRSPSFRSSSPRASRSARSIPSSAGCRRRWPACGSPTTHTMRPPASTPW